MLIGKKKKNLQFQNTILFFNLKSVVTAVVYLYVNKNLKLGLIFFDVVDMWVDLTASAMIKKIVFLQATKLNRT